MSPRPLAWLFAAFSLAGCNQAQATQLQDTAISAAGSASNAGSEIGPDPNRLTRPSSVPAPAPTPDASKLHQVPCFLPDGRSYWGFGTLQLSTGPTRKSVRDEELLLRYLLAHYKGKDWLPHLTIVPWYGGQYTLVAADVWPQSADALCSWALGIGWYREDGRGRGMCRYHRSWYGAKP